MKSFLFKYSFWCCLYIAVFLIGFSFKYNNHFTQQKLDEIEIISSDGIWYYSYLPSTFIKKENQTQKENAFYMTFDGNPSTPSNKTFIGTSFLMAPFFGIAHTYTSIHSSISPDSSYEPNGFTLPYQLAVCFGAVFYLILGLFFIHKMAIGFGVNKALSKVIIVIFALGSQLLMYSSYESSYAHIYAFFTISILLYNWNKFTLNPNSKNYLLVYLFSAILILIRPTDILILLVFPIFLSINGYKKCWSWALQNKWIHIVGLLIGFSIALIQMIYWKVQSGSFILYTYGDEGFDFLNPQFYNVLFSYKKGLFIYTPLLFVSLLFISLSKLKTPIKIWLGIFFILNTYVISSWWSWWYGGSYGMRPWVDFIQIILLLTILAVQRIKRTIFKVGFILLGTLCVVYNLVQTFQFSKQIIHWESMNKAKFWQVFMQTKPVFYFLTYDQDDDYKTYNILEKKSIKLSETFSSIKQVDEKQQYFSIIEIASDSILLENQGLFIKVKFQGKMKEMDEGAYIYWDRNFDSKENLFTNWKLLSLIRKKNSWQDVEVIMDLNKLLPDEKKLSINFFNNKPNTMWFRNLEMTLHYYEIEN